MRSWGIAAVVVASLALVSCGSGESDPEDVQQDRQAAFLDSFTEQAMEKVRIWSKVGTKHLQKMGVQVVEKSPTGSFGASCPYYGPESFTTECHIAPRYRDLFGEASASTFFFDVDYTDFDGCWTAQLKRIVDDSGYQNQLVGTLPGVEFSGCPGERSEEPESPEEVEGEADPGFTTPERHVPPGTANCPPGYVVVGNDESEMCVAG